METKEKLDTVYTMGEDFYLDWNEDNYIEETVINKFERVKKEIEGKTFYSLTITKIPTRTDYHLFSLENLQQVSRKLTNGLTSFGRITNRQFWSKYFNGGVRKVTVDIKDKNEFPSFTLSYILYSDFDNLDVRIMKNLNIRIKSIDPTLSFKLDHLGKYSHKLITDNLIKFKEIEFSTEMIHKLGVETIEEINQLQFQRPRFLGRLFKTI